MLSKIFGFIKGFLSCFNITYICHIVNKLLTLILDIRTKKEKTEKLNKIEKANKKIEKACDKGSLDDLLDSLQEMGRFGKNE